jgi:parallel beta-helix repeat protein
MQDKRRDSIALKSIKSMSKNFMLVLLTSCCFAACLQSQRINDKQQIIISLKEFGAKGDGVNDDSPAFNRALIYANRTSKHCVFELENATYLMKSGVMITPNVTFKGAERTIIKAEYQTKSFTLFIAANGEPLYDIYFQNIRFEGYAWKSNLIAIALKKDTKEDSDFENINFTNCHFLHFSHAIIINNTKKLRVKNCFFNNVANCFSSLDNEEIELSDNQISFSKNGFIFVDDIHAANSSVKILNNLITKTTNYPIHFSDVYPPYHTNILIKNNLIVGDTIPYSSKSDGGSADQISIFGSKNVKVIKNRSIAGGDMGITVTRSKKVYISGNICAFNDRAGITIAGGSDNVRIKDNILYNNGQRRDDLQVNAGITMYSNDTIINTRIYITENLIYDDQEKPTQIEAINIRGKNNTIHKRRNKFKPQK